MSNVTQFFPGGSSGGGGDIGDFSRLWYLHQQFTSRAFVPSNTTFVVPPGTKAIRFIGVGGGQAGTASTGGPGGGYFEKTYEEPFTGLTTSFQLTIGAAGGNTVLADSAGTTIATAFGATAISETNPVGVGGTASGGDVNYNGSPGGTTPGVGGASGGKFGDGIYNATYAGRWVYFAESLVNESIRNLFLGTYYANGGLSFVNTNTSGTGGIGIVNGTPITSAGPGFAGGLFGPGGAAADLGGFTGGAGGFGADGGAGGGGAINGATGGTGGAGGFGGDGGNGGIGGPRTPGTPNFPLGGSAGRGGDGGGGGFGGNGGRGGNAHPTAGVSGNTGGTGGAGGFGGFGGPGGSKSGPPVGGSGGPGGFGGGGGIGGNNNGAGGPGGFGGGGGCRGPAGSGAGGAGGPGAIIVEWTTTALTT